MSAICEVPIKKTGVEVLIDGTPKTLEDLGIKLRDDVETIKISFDESLELKVIARFAADPSATISSSVGNIIISGDVIELNKFGLQGLLVAVDDPIPAHVTQFGKIIPCDFTDAYRNLIAQVLTGEPEFFGRAAAFGAKCIKGSNLYKLLNSFGKIFSDFHCRVEDLKKELFASTCVELCDNYANEAFSDDLKDCLSGLEQTEFDRVLTVVAKLVGIGANGVQGYIEIAAALGLVVEIDDNASTFTLTFNFIGADISPMLGCAGGCARMHDGPGMNSILAFACLMEIIAPAQSKNLFTVDGDCEFEL